MKKKKTATNKRHTGVKAEYKLPRAKFTSVEVAKLWGVTLASAANICRRLQHQGKIAEHSVGGKTGRQITWRRK